MLRFTIISLLLCLSCASLRGQHPKGVFNTLTEIQSTHSPKSYAPFTGIPRPVSESEDLLPAVKSGCLSTLDRQMTAEILSEKPKLLQLSVPINEQRSVTLQLYRARVLAPNFTVQTDAGQSIYPEALNLVCYRGIVEGNQQSLVSITIYDNEIRGFISTNDDNLILGKLENADMHIIYPESALVPDNPFNCTSGETTDQLPRRSDAGNFSSGVNRNASQCVSLYLEVEHEIVIDFGTVDSATNFIIGLMNEVFTLYDNEGIAMTIAEIFAYTSNDPYTGSSGNRLDTFTDIINANGGFNGDLAHLIGYGGGGGRAWLDVLCNDIQGLKSAFSSIFDYYYSVPTYSWSVNVVAHEIGHNLGAPHTHDCFWNGNNTAIDGCGYQWGDTIGTCDTMLPPAGTIMSYCHLVNGVGIDFNLGFGTQPGNLMRNKVAAAACLGACYCPDLVVSRLDSMAVDPNVPLLYLSALVRNAGDTIMSGGTTEVEFYGVDNQNGDNPTIIGITSVSVNIAPGDSLVVGSQFALPANIYDKDYIRVDVDVSNTEDECNEQNNTGIFINGLLTAGCTDSLAHNYDPNADVDDGTCETCTDGVLNGDEEDVDCGGVLCTPCNCNIAEWGFIPPPGWNAPTYEASNIDANDMSPSGSISVFNVIGNPGTCAALRYIDNSSIDLFEYMEFGVTPFPPGRLDLNYLYLDLKRNSSGPTNWEIRSSLDAYAGTLASGQFNLDWKTDTVDLSGLDLQSGVISFRVYMWNASSGSGGYGFLDNFEICATYVTCADGIQNGDETDVDCGGSYCAPCDCPDLQMSWIDPMKMDASDSIYVDLEVENTGQQTFSGTFDVDFYMSDNSTLETATDTYLGSTTVDPDSLPAGTSIAVSGILLDNSGGNYFIAAIDELNQSIVECNEDNNQSILDFTTCSTMVSNALNGAPGSLRWAVECAPPGATISFMPGMVNDTIYLRNIDPIEIMHALSIDAVFSDNINLAPHPDNQGTGGAFEFNGHATFSGLRLISPVNGKILHGYIKSGGKVEFIEVDIREIELKKSP